MRPFTVAEVIGAVRAATDNYSIPPDATLADIVVDEDDGCATVTLAWDNDGTPCAVNLFRSRLLFRLLSSEGGIILNPQPPTKAPDALAVKDEVGIEVNGETI